jgi:alpha-amylase
MTRRCNAVGVRIYPDILLNHMSATTGPGTGSSTGSANTSYLDFPAVPFTTEHFNKYCSLDWNSATSIRDCWLIGLPDLNLKHQHVRDMQIGLLNKLIDLGVAGFRFDAMKHMWPEDLEYILSRMKNLNTNYGFPANTRPFVVGEVIQGDGIVYSHYTHLGAVTVFEASRQLGQSIRGHASVSDLKYWPNQFGVQSKEALIFVDNHDNQRDGGLPLTNHREPRIYKAATAFNLANDFGIPRLMSSFYFDHRDQGPPADASFHILTPTFDADGQCNNGWVCEHRWKPIRNMVSFRNAVKGTKVEKWWDGWSQIGFARGSRGYFVLNSRDNGDGLSERLDTGLPAGTYCDMATGVKSGGSCTGKSVTVGSDGYAQFELERGSAEMFIAIHVDAKL